RRTYHFGTNDYGFIVAGHTIVAKVGFKLSDELVQAIHTVDTLPDEKLHALAVFTLQVINQKGQVSDDDLKAFYAAGYGEQQALETVLGVSLATLCNYANNLAKTPINPELQPFAL